MTISKILSVKGQDVVTIAPDAPIVDAVELLENHGIGAIVATDAHRKIKGILSERDIVRAIAQFGSDALERPTSRVMTKDVKTCTPSDKITDVMRLMTRGKFRHVPVEINGQLAGIISIGDVVKQRIAEIETEKNALQDYIMAG